MKRSAALMLVLVVPVAVAGCSSKKATSGSPVSTTPPTPSPAANTINIYGFAYDQIKVAPGATITVNNLDPVEHTLSSADALFRGVDVTNGEPQNFTAPTTPGTYALVCGFHPQMHGILVVE